MVFVTDIQRFCIHDGPGIRTTIFVKGCRLQCPWCCNVECICPSPEVYYIETKCLRNKDITCFRCESELIKVPSDYLSIKVNKSNYEYLESIFIKCPSRCLGIYGREYTIKEIMDIIYKDRSYFNNSHGGVTISGGEPLLYDLTELYDTIKKEGISLAIETSLFTPLDILQKSFEFIDFFIIDIKVLDSDSCEKIIKGQILDYVKNVEFLLKNVKRDRIIFRFIVVPGVTDVYENLKEVVNFLKKYEITTVELIPVHNLGKDKYKSLGKSYRDFKIPSIENLKLITDLIEKNTDTKVLWL